MAEIKVGDLVTYTKAFRDSRGITEVRMGIVEAIRETDAETLRYRELMGQSTKPVTTYQVAWETPDGRTGATFARKSNLRLAK